MATNHSSTPSADLLRRAAVAAGSGALLATSAGAFVGGAAPAGAATTFTVDSLADTSTGSGTSGTLRWAIEQANITPGHDVITFDPSVTGTIDLTAPLPDITEELDILGPGAANLVIDGGWDGTDENGGGYQILFLADISGTVTIDGLTLTNGNSSNGNQGVAHDDTSGGAIAMVGRYYYTQIDFNADITLSNLVITHNYASNDGGGIHMWVDTPTSTSLTISNCIVANNSAGNGGGGLYVDVDFYGDGDPTLSPITIENSSFVGNSAGDDGGGLYFSSDIEVSITNTTIAGNTAGAHTPNSELYMDPGYFNGGDGGGVRALLLGGGTVAIANTTISGNSAQSGFRHPYYQAPTLEPWAGNGGGIASLYGTPVVALNSTISGNHADAIGGAISARQNPAGPYYDARSTGVVLVASTVTENSSGEGMAAIAGNEQRMRAGALSAPATGRPETNRDEHAERSRSRRNGTASAPLTPTVAIDPLTPIQRQLTLISTIVAGNGTVDIAEFGADAPLTVASTNSIIGTLGTGAVLSDQGGTQLIPSAGSLLLGPLAANGGPTLTHALLLGSPAIDTGGTSLPAFTGDQFDQRGPGFARIIGGFVDVGAYEYEPIAPKFTG